LSDPEKTAVTRPELKGFSARPSCSSAQENSQKDSEFLEPLNRILTIATEKIQASQFIEPMQILLRDSASGDNEKFLWICHLINQGYRSKANIKSPLRANALSSELAYHNFCKLFNREVLDFFSKEIKNILQEKHAEIMVRLENVYKWLDGQMVKPSPLRDLLSELKNITQCCAKKNRWPVPTGIKRLGSLLENLDWLEDEELPQLLKDCMQAIGERINYFYLYRDNFTYFLYRNFYLILSEVSANSFAEVAGKIACFRESAIASVEKSKDAFAKLYACLSQLKNYLSAPRFNTKGKTLGIFANKPPDGIHYLRMYLNQLPADATAARDEDQVRLIKIFMQIKAILAQKVNPAEKKIFRDAEVNALYENLHKQIECIYTALSVQDQEVFLVTGMELEKRDLDLTANLAIPQGCALLWHGEKIYSPLAEMENMLQTLLQSSNQQTHYSQQL
jgi:hypothetical protein